MAKKQSAGILVYRRAGNSVQVLLGHPGGPFWGKKDKGAWSIPKGEIDYGEDLLTAAKREFSEELGKSAPEGDYQELGLVERPGKTIYVWAVEADLDVSQIKSNEFEMEWPPKSGQMQKFVEIDRAEWFDIAKAGPKMHQGQSEFLERLGESLGLSKTSTEAEQTSLFE